MTLTYFQDARDRRYHEVSDEAPARTEDGKIVLLKDLPPNTCDVEVYIDGVWTKGYLPGEPKKYTFHIECVSWDDEKTVHGIIHDGLIKNYNARDSKLPWHRIIAPSKQPGPCLPDESYIVIAREDRQPDGSPGRFTLASRQIFQNEGDAKAYAEGVSLSREAIVIPGRFKQLRGG